MTAFLVVPPDLIPTALAYRDDLPEHITNAIEKCLDLWRQGDTHAAIRRAREAQQLAEACKEPVCTSVILILLTDLYRAQDELLWELLCCREVREALRLQPCYRHRYHAEAVICYLRGLLNHTLGTNIGALACYGRAVTSFEKASKRWKSEVIMDPTHAGKYENQAEKCDKAIKWIEALRRGLGDDLSPVRDRTEIHIPAVKREQYELARLKLTAPVPPPYVPPLMTRVLPRQVVIDDDTYHLHHPISGAALDDDFEVPGNESLFAFHVPDDRWAGAPSAQGDYILVRRQRKADNPMGAGVLWDPDREQWEYGTFARDPATREITFEPLDLRVIGGEKVGDQVMGTVRALLKPE